MFEVNCIGGQVSGASLLELDSDIWEGIAVEMFRKGNGEFIDKFIEKINMKIVCLHFSTDDRALSEHMIMRYLTAFGDDAKLLSCANLTNVEIFKEHQHKFGPSLSRNPHFVAWHSKWVSRNQGIGNGFPKKITDAVPRTGMPPHYKKKQATDEERRQANILAGIAPDPFNLAETPLPKSKYLTTKELPENAIRHEVHFVDLTEKWNTKSAIYEYRDILPNRTLGNEKRKAFMGSDPEVCARVLSRIPKPEIPLNPLAYFPSGEMWISEVDLEKDIGFIMNGNVVEAHILQHYKKAICKNIEFISGSNYLTQDFFIYFGEIVDWERVNPLLYTPEIVANYPTKVFTKYVFMMSEYDQLPNKKVFDDAYTELIAIVDKYKSEREAIIEKMAREKFIKPTSNETDMQAYFMETLGEDN
jgi:hypothetical protein